MKPHYYKMRNSDVNFSNKLESVLYDIVPEETLVTEDVICTLYDVKKDSKPTEYPYMSHSSIVQYIRLLTDKRFLKAYQPFELRNSLKLGR